MVALRFVFEIGEKLVHLRDDRLQLPGVGLASSPFLKFSPTLGLLEVLGPIAGREIRVSHQYPRHL